MTTSNCRHCDMMIHRLDTRWVHSASGSTACAPITSAGPRVDDGGGVVPYSPSVELKAVGRVMVSAFSQGLDQAREALGQPSRPTVAPPCPDHVERQHRDGKVPWCNNCGWTRAVSAQPAVKQGPSHAERRDKAARGDSPFS